ncbi:MmgE/PrpD family protein [Parafrankia sp. BMG5.11]|uniref:MmgE/PrpD family protein n=1 Tax=Parafrankia sp. BMG5.11 TaxID=222540 RepID=UPI00103D8B87|nr:MmgE/PrpD family protein [Parafrankia sp. BMG5.11]TCJ31402.1 MmgE/PrpD family protein [Parafrankia sp. BMG5.11]
MNETRRTGLVNLTRIVAEYAASTSIDALPADVRERGRLIVMDELACAVFGQTRTAGKLATGYAASMGGAGACRILGTEYRTTAPYAALANGTAGHADEVDGAHVVGGHPGATIVHAVAAIAEQRRATGGTLLNAVVLGYEIGNRLIRACGGVFGVKSRLHMHADFLHAIGATVAGCRILGLGPEAYGNAMALATFQANGLVALFQEQRHISKSFCNGQYAFAGVSAALMANAGLEGCEDVLGSENGLLAAWGLEDGASSLTDGLGHDYAVMGANFKFVNAGYPIHAAVEAAMTVIHDHRIQAAEIDTVEIGMPTNALRVVDNRAMHNICLQDMLGAAIVQDGLKLRESPFPLLLSDPGFQSMRRRIRLRSDAELDTEQPNGRGARVTFVMRDGSRLSRRVDQPKGHSAGDPIGWGDLRDKWVEALPTVDVDRLVRLSRTVEELDDVEELLRIFDPPRRTA